MLRCAKIEKKHRIVKAHFYCSYRNKKQHTTAGDHNWVGGLAKSMHLQKKREDLTIEDEHLRKTQESQLVYMQSFWFL